MTAMQDYLLRKAGLEAVAEAKRLLAENKQLKEEIERLQAVIAVFKAGLKLSAEDFGSLER